MKTCLVVDDSRVIRKVARKILEELDFECVEAADGSEAEDSSRSCEGQGEDGKEKCGREGPSSSQGPHRHRLHDSNGPEVEAYR